MCLDTACAEWGAALEAELHSVDGKTQKEIEAKMTRKLRHWLDLPAQYRDPVKAGVVAPPPQIPTKREED